MEFKISDALTFGLELELQVVTPETGRLAPAGGDIYQVLKAGSSASCFAMEATLATIEVNSRIHHDAPSMLADVLSLVGEAKAAAIQCGADLRGGGTQITQFWNERITAPSPRAQELQGRFGFLPKRFSTYGMHVHVGMPHADTAIRVANVLQAICPLFIALSAASPFLQLSDTGFAASRPLEPLVYPNGGPMPWLRDWAHLEAVTQDLYSTGIAHTLKDIYWDVRPKPEFGTVEVRVFDTPLSVRKAVALAAFTRGVAALALQHRLDWPDAEHSSVTQQRVSRFLACRDGMQAKLFNPATNNWIPALAWFEQLMALIMESNLLPQDTRFLQDLKNLVQLAPDHAVMRSGWEQLSPKNGDPKDWEKSLSAYSAILSSKLLV